jgi:radical SAM enzyme (TIGR01210 family)
LPNAARLYRETFFGGRSLTTDEHYGLFAENLARLSSPHTLCVFNAGSFLAPQANPVELQERIVRLVATHPAIQRLVIESRAELITPQALEPLAAILAAAGKGFTIRVGVETQDDPLRLKKLRKGHTRAQLSAAIQTMAHAHVTPGAYCLLNPAPQLDHRWAVDEAEATLSWVLEELCFAEAYFCATCVAPSTPLERSWQAGEFTPASLWEVWEVLRRTVPDYGRRIHLLPFVDEPSLVAIPSNHVSTGIPEDLSGADGCDLQFHRFFADYRAGVVTAEALLGSFPECTCRPGWMK